MDPVVLLKEPTESITVTPAEIIYHRRLRVLEQALMSGNVAETCRTFGISRTRFYEWRNRAERYGVEALMTKDRRAPQLPNATPTWLVEELLALAVAKPTLGCRQLADELGRRGYAISKTTVQKHLVDHGLGKRAQRLARAAAIAGVVVGAKPRLVGTGRRNGGEHGSAGCDVGPRREILGVDNQLGHQEVGTRLTKALAGFRSTATFTPALRSAHRLHSPGRER